MANDSFDDPGYEDEPPKKEGMSTGMKVVLILLAIGGVALLVCCGLGIYFASQFGDAFTDDPARVAEIRSSIVDIELPEGYSSEFGADMNFFGMFVMQMAVFTDGEGGVINLMQMNVPNASEEEMHEQMQQQMRDQGQGQGENFTVTESETKEFEVRGKTVEFTFAKGTTENGTEARMITGVFPGKDGTAMLQMIIHEENYDEAVVTEVIESIE